MTNRNYHTHTERCKHATGTVADYCGAAMRHGLTRLGISDHVPLPDGRWSSVRMDMSELADYCREIDAARVDFPDLVVHKAFECEYDPTLVGYYRDELMCGRGAAYLVGGAHWFPFAGEWRGVYGGTVDAATLRAYTDHVVDAIASGLFAFIAHPDLFGNAYLSWDEEARACSRSLITASISYGVPLEINGYGLRKEPVTTAAGIRPKYPWLPFWELAGELGAAAVVSSDAHRPEDVAAGLVKCSALAAACGLRVVDPLESPPSAATIAAAVSRVAAGD